MRKSPLAEGKRWLAQATADLHWAEHLARFLSQQVTEKARKEGDQE